MTTINSPHVCRKSYHTDIVNPTSVDLEANYTLQKESKTDFITKIYTTLCFQLSITFAMSLAFYRSMSITNYVVTHPEMLYASIALTFVFLILSMPCLFGKTHPLNLVCLFGFTICESYSVAYVSLFYTAPSVIMAWGMTLSTFIFLTIYVFQTKEDFNFLGAGLYSCLWVLILGGFIQLVFLPNSQFLNTAMAILGSMVAIGYILYDTSEIIHRMEKDEYIFACMNLYLDIIMLFLRLLELFGDRRE